MSFYLREPIDVTARSRTGVDWEECACPLCAGTTWAPLAEGPDQARGGKGLWFMIVQCHHCGLCFTNPRPSARGIGSFYPAHYGPHQLTESKGAGPSWWQRLPLVRQRPDVLRKTLPIHGQGRLLDFGCGSGSFLLRMRRQGWKVTGLDASEAVVARLRGQLGLHALSGSLPHPALEDASFDVITMWQSLEHVHQPLEVLQAARQILAPGGKLIATVPNIDSLAFRWFGSAWSGLDLPRHLVHFTPETLRRMLRGAGFSASRVAMVRRGSWLRASARLAARHLHREPRWLRWLQSKALSNFAGWYGYWTGQADCLMVTATRT
jgi:SAM-dependent methyltransferase